MLDFTIQVNLASFIVEQGNALPNEEKAHPDPFHLNTAFLNA